MKKLILFVSCLFMVGGLLSQSIAEGRKLLYYERYEGAAHLLQSVVRADPNNAEAWWLLTRASLQMGRVKEIKDSLLLLPPENARAPLILCAFGAVLLQENKKDSAAVFFTRALEETKDKDLKVMLAIAKANQDASTGDPGYAADLLGKAIKRDKRNPELWVTLGNIQRKLQNGTDSYKAYQDALNQDSRYAEAHYRLGKIFVTQGNREMYLKYFNDAVTSDSLYAPAWYDLYFHYYFRDVNKAMDCLHHYIAASDKCLKNDYLMTDLLFASKKYKEAIQHARDLIGKREESSEPRLYKLIAYSYKELNDSAKALDFMRRYFREQNDTAFVVKDFETMGEIYDKMMKMPDSAVSYYARACGLEKDSLKRLEYDKKLADIYKILKDYPNQAKWLGRYYQGNAKSTNLDLFNWGLAHYMAKEFSMADSVFGLYETKYPDQDFGYYWRARADVAIDTAMETGLAIPHYRKLIEISGKDSANKTIRRHLIEAYGYLAAYKANKEKDYTAAIGYFGKLLDLDPDNSDARKYIEVLKKTQSKAESKASAKDSQNKEKKADNTPPAAPPVKDNTGPNTRNNRKINVIRNQFSTHSCFNERMA